MSGAVLPKNRVRRHANHATRAQMEVSNAPGSCVEEEASQDAGEQNQRKRCGRPGEPSGVGQAVSEGANVAEVTEVEQRKRHAQ